MNFKRELEELKKEADFILYGYKIALAKQIKILMQKKGITKKELAKKMGVSPAYINKLLSGDGITLKSLAKVMVALGLPDYYVMVLPEEYFLGDKYWDMINKKAEV
jgi:transcriptional regulator with XRE-family HTH domain